MLCLFACQSNDSKYIIKGTLPTAQQDGEWIYLAPMENASIENIDSTVIAQRPKLLPYRPQMAENIAAALGIEKEQVSVKATTEEGLGFTGTGEGISAQAIALLSSVADYAPEDRVGIISGGCGGCPGCRQQQ